MKRSLSFRTGREGWLVLAGTALVAGTYGLVRLAYGLHLPDISDSVSLSTATAGFISSGSSVVYCVGALAGVVLGTRPRILVVGALLTACGGSVAMALAPTLAVLAPAVIVASAGAGLASPGLVGVVARTVAPARSDTAQATVNSGTGPGLVAAGVLALALPDWRVAFVLAALLTALAGLGVLVLDRGRGTAPDAAGRPGDGMSLSALRTPAVAALLLGAASAAVWTYGRTQLAADGAGSTVSVLAWIALGVGGTATVLTAARLGAQPPQHAWRLTCVVVAAATATLGVAALPLALRVVACAAFGWSFVAASSALIAWAGRAVPGRGAAGTAVLFVALTLGQAAGAAAAGVLADAWGMSWAFVLAGLVALGAAACGRTRRPGARVVPTREPAARRPG